MYAYIDTYIHTYNTLYYTYIHTKLYYAYIHTYIILCTHTYAIFVPLFSANSSEYLERTQQLIDRISGRGSCMYVCMLDVCMYVCMYCMYVCMYVWQYLHSADEKWK